MLIFNSINNLWKNLQEGKSEPQYVTKINIIKFTDLKKNIDKKKFPYLKNIIKKIYHGEAFILRGAADKKLKDTIIELAKAYDKKEKPSFHKMLDGCPNFHRIIDKKITKKYSTYAIKHVYLFYNWNIRTKLEKKLKDSVYKHWRYIKFLSGNKKSQYEKNIPSQNQIDRLQIVRYPLGGGELRDHADPGKNQKIVSGLIMSKIGEDFNSGGFFFRNINKKKVNIEKKLEIGDSVIFYASLIHGVEPVDKKKKIDWKSYNGRWFVGMFVNDSNSVKNRITADDVSGKFKYIK